MSNRLLIAIVAILVAVAAVVVILAYTYLDVGLGPKSGGDLRVALSSFSAETLDPSLDNADGLKYHGHAYDFLVGVDGEGRLDTRYGLLTKWQASPTADSFTLTLRNNAFWHDGEPVTAGDVRASLDYYFREDATCGHLRSSERRGSRRRSHRQRERRHSTQCLRCRVPRTPRSRRKRPASAPCPNC